MLLILAVTLAAVLVAALLALTGAVLAVARRIIHPAKSRPTAILSVSSHRITLAATPMTEHAGVLGLLYANESQHAGLGPILAAPEGNKGVQRTLSISSSAAQPIAGTFGRPVGNVFPDAKSANSTACEVAIATPEGSAPAWFFEGTGKDAATWVIHVHGSLSGREGAFRSVHSIATSGYSSLVPSLRGDGEGPPAPRGAFTLGQTEWHDVDAALEYAVNHGATRVVALGWSSGASICLRLAADSIHRNKIIGLILVSPVLSWPNSIIYSAVQAKIPRAITRAAMWALGVLPLSKLLGSPEPLKFRELNWIRERRESPIPLLVIHSEGDSTTPFADTARFASLNREQVELAKFDGAGHALEWNTDPSRFKKIVRTWLTNLTTPQPDPGPPTETLRHIRRASR